MKSELGDNETVIEIHTSQGVYRLKTYAVTVEFLSDPPQYIDWDWAVAPPHEPHTIEISAKIRRDEDGSFGEMRLHEGY
jgi:hypothetical protein